LSLPTPATVPRVIGLPHRDRSLIMGIVNVTADSFSDGGRFIALDDAVARGLQLTADGADLVDVGGESTRPGAQRVQEDLEAARVVPVVRELARAGVLVSIDTTRSAVAQAAVEAGAVLVNDVSGGLADPVMAGRVAELAVPYVATHWRAPSADMHRFARYDDVVADVIAELGRRLDALVDAGIDPARIIFDPGLGFAKKSVHNWQLLAGLARFDVLGRPLLIGASRKAFLGEELGRRGLRIAPRERDVATAAVTAITAAEGVFCLRVHDVFSSLQAAQIAAAFRRAGSPGEKRA
jgi:dihydropteroate synthase